MQHLREHLPVDLDRGAREVGHQVNVHFEARVLQKPQSVAHLLSGASAVDLLEDGVIGVLHAQLDARAAIPSQPVQLHLVNVVRPHLEGEPDNFAARALIQPLLLF
eukprot:CAMPEP_0195579104 /NCGR_PEP_ID=MMETSP0814-20130614/13590_1 /TAXON_ID=97485 /ORGANISM="Prymnesium parvum, Strain Texoma1" /LENGTH=105 /DNA_ID=CAMNT_0040715781 /DNA_START=53 /DNA_END=370 /DNA_ORIENTATION=-